MLEAAHCESPFKSMKKAKLPRSCVYDEFETISIYNRRLEEDIDGSKCKTCQIQLLSSNSTNLKNHLKAKHIRVYQKVKKADEKALAEIELENEKNNKISSNITHIEQPW